MVSPNDLSHQVNATLSEPDGCGAFGTSIAKGFPVFGRRIEISFVEQPIGHSKLSGLLLQVLVDGGDAGELHPDPEFVGEVEPAHF